MQDLEKHETAAEKKRETMMVGLNQTKSQLSTIEAALARNQVDMEKVQFELQAKKGASPGFTFEFGHIRPAHI